MNKTSSDGYMITNRSELAKLDTQDNIDLVTKEFIDYFVDMTSSISFFERN